MASGPRTLAAELGKIRTLPAVAVTLGIAAAVCGLLGGALAASADGSSADPVSVMVQLLPVIQAAFLVLGVLPVVQEYAGRQLSTSLLAIPRRGVFLAAKTAATTLVLAGGAVLTVGTGTVGAIAAGPPSVLGVKDCLHLSGAACHLVLIGLLASVVALVVRRLIAALAVTAGVVLVVSPLLAGALDLAQWLPDRAAASLYDQASPVHPAAGAAVAVGWIVVLGVVGAVRFIRDDVG